jgi:glycosyl transferase family 2
MRLSGVTMVRNEADVIEAFVRHNLRVLDGLAIVDHGSVDGTSNILAMLQGEGLPLQVMRDLDPAYRQSTTMSALARAALAGDAADFVFALDADEFLKLPSRATLEQALAEVPAQTHAVLHWFTYVPDVLRGPFGRGHLRRRLKNEPSPLYKVVVGRSFLESPGDSIGIGNHLVQSDDGAPPRQHARLREEVAMLAHCPVRSRDQLIGKIVVGHLAYLLTGPTKRRFARHWRELYEELRDGATLDEARLREIACNYGAQPKDRRPLAEIELIEDPVELFVDQRYGGDAITDPLRLLAHFTEALIAAGAAPAPANASTTQYHRL